MDKETRFYWVRAGPLDDWSSVQHISQRRGAPIVRTYCGQVLDGKDWNYGNEEGWRWVSAHRAKICLDCVRHVGLWEKVREMSGGAFK